MTKSTYEVNESRPINVTLPQVEKDIAPKMAYLKKKKHSNSKRLYASVDVPY